MLLPVELSMRGGILWSMTFNGASAAVSLTYDDGMPGHLDAAMPDLEACSLRGTFYLMTGGGGNSTWVTRRNEWVAAAAPGMNWGTIPASIPAGTAPSHPICVGTAMRRLRKRSKGANVTWRRQSAFCRDHSPIRAVIQRWGRMIRCSRIPMWWAGFTRPPGAVAMYWPIRRRWICCRCHP